MFREMRRKDRELNYKESAEILKNNTYGILSTVSPDGYPYGVPLSYVYRNNAIYFHCAGEGHKLENLSASCKVSFCVVGQTSPLPEKFSTGYESVIAFGHASEVIAEEKNSALLELIMKYSPDFIEKGKVYMQSAAAKTKVFKINISHLTGKANR